MIPVKDHHGFFRDQSTNAILNCNSNEYQERLKLKQLKLKEKNEIEALKSDIDEIKSALKVILEKINK